MGTSSAMGMAAEVRDGLRLDVALHWHLTSNHCPPIPVGFVGLAKEAIELANLGDWENEIELDEGAYINGHSSITVSDVVDKMHLNSFLDLEEF
jgi:hypothetical protein